jgi:outer membrane lipoprotein carrier protein
VNAPRAHTGLRSAWLLGAALLVYVPASSAAATSTPLDQFLENLQSLRATFTQVVVDAKGKELESGQGTLLVRRPGRFRWEYTPAGAGPQLLVADGANLWFYDRDLQQATVKPAAAALTTTPVILLSGTAAEMRAAFNISDEGMRDELAWVQVTPRSATAEFSSAELGFHGTQLTRLIIHDRLNQTDTLSFNHSARGARVEESELHFAPPPGVDVIGTPQTDAAR